MIDTFDDEYDEPADEALAWLLENDPLATGTSRRAYGKAIGILEPTVEAEIRKHEVSFEAAVMEMIDFEHCPACGESHDSLANTVA